MPTTCVRRLISPLTRFSPAVRPHRRSSQLTPVFLNSQMILLIQLLSGRPQNEPIVGTHATTFERVFCPLDEAENTPPPVSIVSPAKGGGARSCLRLRLQSSWLRARLRPHDTGGRDRRATQRWLVIVAGIAHRSMPLQKLRDLSAGKCLIFEETSG
jgi:hypothetical protein